MRITGFLTNTAAGGPGSQLADLELRHRRHARVEDRAGKDTGLRNLPYHDTTQNRIWLQIAALAVDLLAWIQRLALTGPAGPRPHKRPRSTHPTLPARADAPATPHFRAPTRLGLLGRAQQDSPAEILQARLRPIAPPLLAGRPGDERWTGPVDTPTPPDTTTTSHLRRSTTAKPTNS